MNKICKKCKTSKDITEFCRDNSEKDRLNVYCRVCTRAFNKSRYQENKENRLEQIKKYKETNKELVRDRNKLYYTKNKTHLLRHIQIWSAFNPEKADRSKWKKDNKEKVASYGINRRASELQRTPPWAKDMIKDYMRLMIRFRDSLTKYTGIKQSIEHIVPLQGKLVSGLNVPWNIELMPLSKNSSKNNKFEPTIKIFSNFKTEVK